jgi:hypothetical protein
MVPEIVRVGRHRHFPACQIWNFCEFGGEAKSFQIMPDQAQKTRPIGPAGPGGGGEGPSAPKIEKPNTEELLKRMRKVDPDQARRYRQRTGQ